MGRASSGALSLQKSSLREKAAEQGNSRAEFVLRLFSFPKTSSHCSASTAALSALKWDLRGLREEG